MRACRANRRAARHSCRSRSAHVGSSTLDLGTVLITEGFAFAAFNNDAKPVYMPYLVAEILARKNRAGL